jgi:hypothetical protein
MISFVAEMLASMAAVSMNIVASAFPFLMNSTSRKEITLSESIFMVNWMEELRLLRWLKKCSKLSGP